jgi:hypothetical protein
MSVVALPLSPDAQARALLHHLLEAGDVIGRDQVGRTVIQLAVGDWLLDQLMAFDADAENLEDDGEAEPDECQVLSFDRVPVRHIYRGTRRVRRRASAVSALSTNCSGVTTSTCAIIQMRSEFRSSHSSRVTKCPPPHRPVSKI